MDSFWISIEGGQIKLPDEISFPRHYELFGVIEKNTHPIFVASVVTFLVIRIIRIIQYIHQSWIEYEDLRNEYKEIENNCKRSTKLEQIITLLGGYIMRSLDWISYIIIIVLVTTYILLLSSLEYLHYVEVGVILWVFWSAILFCYYIQRYEESGNVKKTPKFNKEDSPNCNKRNSDYEAESDWQIVVFVRQKLMVQRERIQNTFSSQKFCLLLVIIFYFCFIVTIFLSFSVSSLCLAVEPNVRSFIY